MTILQVGQVLFSSRYLTRQLRQTEDRNMCVRQPAWPGAIRLVPPGAVRACPGPRGVDCGLHTPLPPLQAGAQELEEETSEGLTSGATSQEGCGMPGRSQDFLCAPKIQ